MPSTICVTFIAVSFASSRFNMLSCVGSMCWISTKAMPVSAGNALRKAVKASRPPADAPMPTIGKGFDAEGSAA